MCGVNGEGVNGVSCQWRAVSMESGESMESGVNRVGVNGVGVSMERVSIKRVSMEWGVNGEWRGN